MDQEMEDTGDCIYYIFKRVFGQYCLGRAKPKFVTELKYLGLTIDGKLSELLI